MTGQYRTWNLTLIGLAMLVLIGSSTISLHNNDKDADMKDFLSPNVGRLVTTTPPSENDLKIIGMSAPANLWDQRVNEVGSQGLTGRRIFADLTEDGRNQANLIQQTVAQGMLPVISYKVPSVAAMIAGDYDQWMTNLRIYLNSFGVQVTATFWHEPYGDMIPERFQRASQKFVNRVKDDNVAVGPILNGWLLDNRVADFAAFTNTKLLQSWDFVGIDTYQSGTAANPGNKLPGRAVPLLSSWLDSQGFPDMRIGVGEYNGHTAEALRYAGETLLSTPRVWFGLVWNSVAGEYVPLEGERLLAYQATKADPRALQ